MNQTALTLAAAAAFCLLTGCTAAPPGAPSPTPPPAQGVIVPDEEKDAPTLLADHYLDVGALPTVRIDVEPEYSFDGRTIRLEDSVDNQMELLTYGAYHADISGDYDPLLEVVNGVALRQSIESSQQQFENGLRLQSCTIHALHTLTAADLQDISEFYLDYLDEYIRSFGLYRYAVVQADVEFTYNDALAAQGPQLDPGRYTRYFLVANTREQPQFMLYDVFWEDFMAEVPESE